MGKTVEKKKVDRKTNQSSISVASKIVCEDEDCIGKAVDGRYKQTGQEERQNKNQGKKPRPGTSMSIAGEDACSDDACIGKT
jgi:hypothetical protein